MFSEIFFIICDLGRRLHYLILDSSLHLILRHRMGVHYLVLFFCIIRNTTEASPEEDPYGEFIGLYFLFGGNVFADVNGFMCGRVQGIAETTGCVKFSSPLWKSLRAVICPWMEDVDPNLQEVDLSFMLAESFNEWLAKIREA